MRSRSAPWPSASSTSWDRTLTSLTPNSESCIAFSLRVTLQYGNSMHYAENMQSGHFAFMVEGGDYLACFWAPDHKPPVSIRFEFDWRSGVSAQDWPNVAKKGKVHEKIIGLFCHFDAWVWRALRRLQRVRLPHLPRLLQVRAPRAMLHESMLHAHMSYGRGTDFNGMPQSFQPIPNVPLLTNGQMVDHIPTE